MSDMQQILAAHSIAGMSAGTHIACRCNKAWVPIADYVKHQAEMLDDAGFGKLPEPIDPNKATIINGWLVVEYGSCTCGGGDSASGYHHESGCGYEPLMNITEVLAATGYTLNEGATK